MQLKIALVDMVKVIIKSLAVWLLIIPLAVLNGAARDYLLQPLLGRYALPASGITLCTLILLLAWLCIPRLGVNRPSLLVVMGLIWAALAVTFESLTGLALGRSVAELLAAYDMSSGNLWLLVVACVGSAPWLAVKMRAARR